MTTDTFLGGCIAFVCAAIAVGTDAQTEVRTRFKDAAYGTSILSTVPGFLFIIGWGLVDVCFYIAFLYNSEWAKRAFNIDVEQNLLWTGIVVGVSAVLIIRTNLATVGSFQIGGEFAYTWSRAFLIKQLSRKRGRARLAFLGRHRPSCQNIAGHPKYFTSLNKVLAMLSPGSADQAKIEKQVETIRAKVANPDADADAREDLTAVMYDYFGPDDIDRWATESDYGNK